MRICIHNFAVAVCLAIFSAGCYSELSIRDQVGTRMIQTFYTLSVNKSGLPLRVSVNGVPILRWSDPDHATSSTGINLWAKPGINEITLDIGWLQDQTSEYGNGRVEVELLSLIEQGDLEEQKSLLRQNWPTGTNPDYPTQLSLTWEAEGVQPTKLWSNAQRTVLSPDDREKILDLTEQLHHAINSKDLESVMVFSALKAKDVGSAMHMGAAEGERSLRDFLEFMVEGPDFALNTLDRESLEIHDLANGLIFLVSGPSFTPAIQSAGVQMEVYISKIDGEFMIIR